MLSEVRWEPVRLMLGRTGEAGSCPAQCMLEDAWLLIAGDKPQLIAQIFSSTCMAGLRDGYER